MVVTPSRMMPLPLSGLPPYGGGFTNEPLYSSRSAATCMKRRKMSAGREPPVTAMPCTDFISRSCPSG